MPLVPFEEITHLFAEFEHTAFRLETRRGYATDRAGERFQAFPRGFDPRPEPEHPWNVNVRVKAGQGARFSRCEWASSWHRAGVSGTGRWVPGRGGRLRARSLS
ncbi:DUF6879 family protein [Streptomyces sp. MBT98]|uniref:DUF6879 family protein n=1 Tax=unclassified Streptomyces TaxID=2593676 RepID=UPI0035AB9154